jgi:alpha 1,2-mannosyltransferase
MMISKILKLAFDASIYVRISYILSGAVDDPVNKCVFWHRFLVVIVVMVASSNHPDQYSTSRHRRGRPCRAATTFGTAISLILSFCILNVIVSPTNKWQSQFISFFQDVLLLDNTTVLLNTATNISSTQNNKPTLNLLREQHFTSQYLPQRNVSRNLCGAIPKVSPTAVRFPNILTSSSARQHPDGAISTSTVSCHTNAILYVVQKGKHASYGRDSTLLLHKSLDLLFQNYLSVNRHYDNVDVLLFHSGDYNQDDLRRLNDRYNYSVHFKLIDLNATDYWTLPETVRNDNTSQWVRADAFQVGYRHMMRWYGLKLYDFARDYAQVEGGCNYRYLMRMDEDSFLLSTIDYDLFDFMQMHNYSYAFRMCSFEMETTLWEDYLDHIQHCGLSLPTNIPLRPMDAKLCGFYNNFFIVENHFMMQPDVQQFVQWIDALGTIYRDRYNDLRIQTMLVYAFLPPERIHRFLDWSYEHMTHYKQCPMWGALQAGYLDPNATAHFDKFIATNRLDQKRCRLRRNVLEARDLSPTYSHLPPSSWFIKRFKTPLDKFYWRTLAAGLVEKPGQGIMSG